MSHTHKVNDRDPYFEIDAVTRKIINKSTSKVSVIQYDHNSEHFTFSLPRYIEDHDMLDCTKAEVHYICAKTKTPGIYEMKDLAVDPEDENKVICTWELSQNVTLEAGAIGFLLRFSCVAEDGTIEYAWNTAIFNGISVAEGIYNAEAIVEQYADILEQWKAEVTAKYTEIQRSLSELESNQSEIQGSLSRTRELLSDFREDQSAMYTTGRILFSNAIKESGSGKVIRFDDVSPIEHNVKVKISGDDIVNMSRTKVHTFGKNIFGFEESFSVTQGGITIDYDNETQIFTLNGTHEKGTSALVIYLNKYYAQHTNLNIFKLDKNEMFTFTVECLGGTVSEESSTNSICITGSDVPSWSGGNLAAVKISEVKKQIVSLKHEALQNLKRYLSEI